MFCATGVGGDHAKLLSAKLKLQVCISELVAKRAASHDDDSQQAKGMYNFVLYYQDGVG